MNLIRIVGGTVITPSGARRADVLLRGQKIARVGHVGRHGRAVDARGLLVFPGAIDAHVHLALPVAGTRSADSWETGTRAAAWGGVTCIADFTIGATVHALSEAIRARMRDAEAAAVDFTLRAEMIGWRDDRSAELAGAAKLGVRAFKFYTAYAESGRRTDLGTLAKAMAHIHALGGVAMIHAEAQELTDPEGGPWPEARPEIAESVAIAELGALARATRCRTYVAHISSAAGLAALLTAQAAGAPLMGETCPHYLLLSQEVYERSDGVQYTVTPPLRSDADRRALWSALRKDQLQAVATDHCPFLQTQKLAAPSRARVPSGLGGLPLLPSLLLSEGVATGRIRAQQAAWYLAEGPARAFGLWPRKGAIQAGADADLLLWDPLAEWKVRTDALASAADFSPYEGLRVRGRIVTVFSRGRTLRQGDTLLAAPSRGRFVPWQE